MKVKFSNYLSSKLGYSYHYLSTVFSTVHGSSIERFYISQRIERVKELLIHGKVSFSEIAYKTHYSSVAHLSTQFKKETGLTLSQFRTLEHDTKLKILNREIM
jgi:AraC-like DNA-binding protein